MSVPPNPNTAPSEPTSEPLCTDVFTLYPGRTPLLVSMPHVGTLLPAEQHARYQPRALEVEDTDWHLEPLYQFAHALGAGVIVPRYSRYLIDLNRPSDNQPMYAGANNTALCPLQFFTGDPLYRAGHEPDAAEVARRTRLYWQPYHDALRTELNRLRQQHGHAVLFDAHSIRSELPWLFEGRLPDLNLGTASGHSAAPALRQALAAVLQAQTQFSHAVDGRFKGGHITRHYGQPATQIHAIQLEMAWRCYMHETPPYAIAPERAAQVLPTLQALVRTMIDWQPNTSL